VDKLYVSLNGYAEIPVFEHKYPNVEFILSTNERGDANKFLMCDTIKGYYLAIDDDLQVSRGYVQYLISGVDKYNGLVSLHGRTYLPPVTNFRKWAGNYRCLNTVSEDVKVNLIGSGCCAFHTDRLTVSLSDFKQKNMADVWLSKLAADSGVPMMVLKHRVGEYLTYLNPIGSTIWKDTKDHSLHVKVMQSFIK
jgi:hypothetical protein